MKTQKLTQQPKKKWFQSFLKKLKHDQKSHLSLEEWQKLESKKQMNSTQEEFNYLRSH